MMIIKTMLRWLLDVAVPVAAFYIALIERKEEKETIRTGNLKRILNNIRGTRHRYSDAALTFYRRQFAEQQDVCVEYTIFRRKWMQQEKDSDFLMLSDIQIRPNQAFWNSAKNPEPRFLPRRKNGYAEEVKAISNVKLINLPAYALSDVQIEKIGNKRTITLDVYGGYYFDFYDTCEVLGAELAHAELRHRAKWNAILGEQSSKEMTANPKQWCKRNIPLRYRQRNLFDLKNRFAAIGVNVLTILQNVREGDNPERHNYFLLHTRSANQVAEGANSFHVVPAGSYQPGKLDFKRYSLPEDISFATTMVREFWEELRGEPEFEELYNPELLRKYETPNAYFLGVCFDPLNTKTEVLGCYMIDVMDAKQSPFGGATRKQEIEKQLVSTYEGSVSLVPLQERILMQYLNSRKSIPAFQQILQVVLEHPDTFGVNA